jgi:NAD(P)-dependent dehydrogenase (short-subunit alcohol dehydrogenase family)
MFDYTPSTNLLLNRVILITGASDGIGRAAAKSFAAHGANVILIGRALRKLEAVYDEIEAAGHPQPAICPLNLERATPNEYEQLAKTITTEFGKLDGLLHNASNLGTLTPLEYYDINLWYQVTQVNLHAPFLLTKACLPLLKKSENAAIVFTSAEVGHKGRAYWGAYAVSKFAIEGMMQVLADELENTSIRVNSVNPGATRTNMRANAYPGEDPMSLPLPEEIMPIYLYLMGNDSLKIHGRSLNAQNAKL